MNPEHALAAVYISFIVIFLPILVFDLITRRKKQ